jgi:putative glycosyltransferase (TIGR04372 family)
MLYPDHFGHQAGDVEYDMRMNKGKLLYIIGSVVPNKALYKIHRRRATFLRVPAFVRRYFIKYQEWLDACLSRIYIYDDPHVWTLPVETKFNEEEEAEGEAILKKLGLEKGKYVCLHARDMKYSKLRHGPMFRERGIWWGHEDQLSPYQLKRNMKFDDYFETIEWLRKVGLKAVRLGADADGAYSHPNLVDYATIRGSLQNPDLADLYILANCKLYAGQATGITTCASALNVPGVGINWFPYMANSKPTPFFRVCRIKRVKYKGQVLEDWRTCHMWDGMDWPKMYNVCTQIEVVDNTPEEICSTIKKAFELNARTAA